MNIKLPLLTAACALALSACGERSAPPATPAPSATPPATKPAEPAPAHTPPAAPATPSAPHAGTPAAGTPAAGTPATGAPAAGTPAAGTPAASQMPPGGTKEAVVTNCATEIEGNDAMQYNVNSIVVPASCTEFKITLKHVGKMPIAAMGHNVVITTTGDMQAVVAEGVTAGLDAGYVKAGDPRIIAHTSMIGGGETTSVSFPVSKIKTGGPHKFFCSFPGHSALMNGMISVK